MSRIIGPSVAVHQAAQVMRQSGLVHRPSTILQPVPRTQIAQLVREVIATPATAEDLNQLAEISEAAQQQNLEPDQVEARLRERTPFASLAQFLPRDATGLAAYLALLVMIVQLIVMLRPPEPPQVIPPEQVEQIIERVIDHYEHQAPVNPPTTTAPQTHCDDHQAE